jgi:hypothetical protein
MTLISGAILGTVVLLTTSLSSQAEKPDAASQRSAVVGPQPSDLPLCGGPSSKKTPSPLTAHPHSVRLTWNAIAAVSHATDAIHGYLVYRSLASRTYAESDRMNKALLQGTGCIDTTVEAGKTYYYLVKAVTRAGKQSAASIEIKAVVPFP